MWTLAEASGMLYVRVDSLSADYAIPNAVLPEQSDKAIPGVGVVECHGFPKRRLLAWVPVQS